MPRTPATPDPLAAVNLLELAPVRLAKWEVKDERVIVHRPKPRTTGLRGLADRISHLLSPPRIRLDPIGSFAWQRLDGETTVGAVAEAVRAEFGESAEPVEDRVGYFVRLLRREEMLAYPGYDEIPTTG